MELFPAANEDQWTLIKQVIDDCDYYIVILAGRYGSIGPEGRSYTEMEYRYALETGKPIIAFVHRDPGTLPANRCEDTEEGKAGLESFRNLRPEEDVPLLGFSSRPWKPSKPQPGQVGQDEPVAWMGSW